MPRGVAHSPELRTEVVAAVLAGITLAQAARRYGIAKRTIANWVESAKLGTDGTDQRTREAELWESLVDLVSAHIATIHAQLQAASRPAWVEKQSAAELAQLVAVERDTALRLLGGLFPAAQQDDPPRLDAPGAPENA